MQGEELDTPSMGGVLDTEFDLTRGSKKELAAAVDAMLESCQESIVDGGAISFPSRSEVAELLEDLRNLIYPGFFGERDSDPGDFADYVRDKTLQVFNKLSVQVSLSVRHGCIESGELCNQCRKLGQAQATRFLQKIPALRKVLMGDVKAAFDRDPAARSLEEIVLSYPGVLAVTIYRLSHELWLQEVPFIPRMMTEYAHSITSIDIHPGATIGSNFFIDHGTGVVIGETTEIGDNVTLYQGVTLGGYGFRRAPDGSLERGYKRHPTIQDGVIIYAGATILGGDTVVGAGSVVGGSVWLTHSVPPKAVVMIKEPDLKYKVGY